jgi:hypothetical protein
MRGHLACVVGTDMSFVMGRSETRWAFSRRCELCSEDLGKNTHVRVSGHVRCDRKGCEGARGGHSELGDGNRVVETGRT